MLNMGAVLLLLIGVADGVKTFCDATQPHITNQCFGSLGGTVEVLLPTKTSQDDIYRLKKNNYQIVEYKTPVSSPLLSRECLSRGQQRVSCSAGGDGLHYSWSLDGLPLNDPRLLSGPSSASDVTLEPGRTGLLSCSVRNHVSHAAANITLSECDAVGPDFKIMDRTPFIARSLTVVLLLLAALGVYWALNVRLGPGATLTAPYSPSFPPALPLPPTLEHRDVYVGYIFRFCGVCGEESGTNGEEERMRK
ncbi:unnamed protein product [Gadus morhua 'NCC']